MSHSLPIPLNYPKQRLLFCLKFTLGFPFVGLVWTGLIFYFSNTLNFKIAYFIGSIGITLGLSSLISQSIYLKIWKVWNKIIFLLDFLITWTILPFFFYAFLTPFGLILQIFNKAKMKRNYVKKSYWVEIEKPKTMRQYLRQF